MTFNLFRKAAEIPIHCAVPDGGALPAFLRGAEWSFVGKIEDLAALLMDADKPHFEAIVRRTGYFVFAAP